MCCRLLSSFVGSVLGQGHSYIKADDGTVYGLYLKDGKGVPSVNDPRDTGGQCFDCPTKTSGCNSQNGCL